MTMRVPGYRRQVESAGAPRVALEHERPGGFDAMARGFGALGAGIEEAYEADLQREEQAKREARAKQVRENLTADEQDLNATLYGTSNPTSQQIGDAAFEGRLDELSSERTPGFLELEGDAAAAAAADTLEGLEQRQQKRAAAITDPDARELYEERSRARMQDARRTVQIHVGNQVRRAKENSLNAAADEAVRAAAVDPTNDALARQRIADVVGSAKAMGQGDAWTQTKTLELQGRVASTRLDALIERGDVAGAERVLDANKWALGANHDKYSKLVSNMRAGEEAQLLAFDAVKKGLGDDGQVNQAAVLDALEQVPAEKRARVEPIVYKLMAEREQAYAAETRRISRASFSLYNTKGWGEFNKSGLSTELNYRNPELYNRLRDDARSQYERALRQRRGTAEDRRQQTAIDTMALNDFKALPVREQATADIGEFLLDRGVSDVGRSRLTLAQGKARALVEKGHEVPMDGFVTDYVAEAQPFAPKRAPKKVLDAWKRAVRADAVDLWTDALEAHPDRKPSVDELAKRKAERFSSYAFDANDPEAVKRSNEALVSRFRGGGAQQTERAATAPPAKFEVLGPNGARGMATEAWLAAHPDWRKK